MKSCIFWSDLYSIALVLVMFMFSLFIFKLNLYLPLSFAGVLQVSSRVLFGLLVLSWKFLVIVISVQGLLLILMLMYVLFIGLLALMLVLTVIVSPPLLFFTCLGFISIISLLSSTISVVGVFETMV